MYSWSFGACSLLFSRKDGTAHWRRRSQARHRLSRWHRLLVHTSGGNLSRRDEADMLFRRLIVRRGDRGPACGRGNRVGL
jgi:hypothetical protein